MLLSTLVKTIKRKSHRGNQAVTTDQITTDIVACANEALRDVYKQLPKRFLWKQGTLTATTGTQGTPYVFSLASDCQEAIEFWYTLTPGNVMYNVAKVFSDREWLGRIFNVSTPPNVVYWFRNIGLDASGYRQVEMFPSFSSTYVGTTINYEYYIKKPSDLTTSDLSSEIPVIPDLYHDVVEKGALYYFLKGFDDPKTGEAFADYGKAREAIDEADEQNQDGDLSLRWSKIKMELPGFRLY